MTLKKSKLIVLRTLKKVEWKITAVLVSKVLPSKPLTDFCLLIQYIVDAALKLLKPKHSLQGRDHLCTCGTTV